MSDDIEKKLGIIQDTANALKEQVEENKHAAVLGSIGATVGVAIGSLLLPGIGTIIGAALGAGIGAAVGNKVKENSSSN